MICDGVAGVVPEGVAPKAHRDTGQQLARIAARAGHGHRRRGPAGENNNTTASMRGEKRRSDGVMVATPASGWEVRRSAGSRPRTLSREGQIARQAMSYAEACLSTLPGNASVSRSSSITGTPLTMT